MDSLAKLQMEHEKSSLKSSDIIHQGPLIALRKDIIKDPMGKDHHYDIVEHPGACVMIPVADDGKLHLVKQWRRAAGQILLELPAGTLEKNEEPIYCAQRELQEEIGYRANKLTPLGGFYTAPGFCDEYLHLFLAEELEESVLPGDDSEKIDQVTLSFDEALKYIDNGKITDAKTILGIYRYLKSKETLK